MDRRGYTSRKSIPLDILYTLNSGSPSQTLSEALAVDMNTLFSYIFPNIQYQKQNLKLIDRFKFFANILYNHSKSHFELLKNNSSDIAKGWACFMVPYISKNFASSLQLMQPFILDNHFLVREWAWIAIRDQFIDNLDANISLLDFKHNNFLYRRFCSEISRPRGVWCKHINAFKKNQNNILDKCIPMLKYLCTDENMYVKNSLANWINDCSKDNLEWIKNICSSWNKNNIHTKYILKRGFRNTKNQL